MDSLNEYLSDSAPIRRPVPAAAAVTCNGLEDGGAALFCHQGGNTVVLLGAGASSCLRPLCVSLRETRCRSFISGLLSALALTNRL